MGFFYSREMFDFQDTSRIYIWTKLLKPEIDLNSSSVIKGKRKQFIVRVNSDKILSL